jgi:putative endonuclease
LPLVAFGPRGRGPSRELRRSCHVISPRRKTWSRLVRRADHHAKNRISRRQFVYVLRSAMVARLYIGSSAEPDARLGSHNAGRVRSTKAGRPWERVLLEEYSDRATAEKRERYLKSGWGRRESLQRFWRGGRAVECGGLENRCGPCAHRGFESHPLRLDVEVATYVWDENFSSTALREAQSPSEAKFAELAAGEIIPPSPTRCSRGSDLCVG